MGPIMPPGAEPTPQVSTIGGKSGKRLTLMTFAARFFGAWASWLSLMHTCP